MGKMIDLTGRRFGKWTVINRVGSAEHNREATWRCRCDCGVYSTVDSSSLRRGLSMGCTKCAGKGRRRK